MRKRRPGLGTRLVPALGLCLLLPLSAVALKPNKLNVLFISVDTLRADFLSCAGGMVVSTPAIDRLASPGIMFRRALAHTPLTLPSHVNMLTGTSPLVHGVHDNLGFRLAEAPLTLAEHLQANGYQTAAFVGAFPLDSRFGLDQGFDLYDDLYGEKKKSPDFHFVERRAEDVVQRAQAWILGRGKGRWFAFVHLFDPHQPYAPPPPYDRRFAKNPYAGEIAYVDECLGRLLDRLRKDRLLEDTLVVFTSDHGESLGEHGEMTHGYFAYNSTLHVPLILHAPALFRESRAVDDFVSHVDIFPTLCGLLGLVTPTALEGRSLLPLLEGGKPAARPIYFESLSPFFNRNWAPLRGVVLEGRKYIDLPLPELYDLRADFKEMKNLLPAGNPASYRQALGRLTAQGAEADRPRQKEQREVSEALRSLGYLASSGGQKKKFYTPQDDLKTLLPLHLRLMEAAALNGRGDAEDAVRLLRELTGEKKDFAAAFEYLANILQQRGDRTEAKTVLEKGLASSPSHAQLRGRLGILLSEMGDQQGAVREIRRAIDLNPDDAEFWNYIGVAYWKLQELDKAEECYRQALALDRNYAGALNNLGSLYLTRKDPDKALAFFERSLEFDPRLAAAHNGRAVVLGMRGNLEQAVESWQKAVALEPGYQLALYNLGLALVRLNRPQEALPHLEKYLEVAPPDDPDREKIVRLTAQIKNRT